MIVTANRSRLGLVLAALAPLLPPVLTAQQPALSGLYRLYQGGNEVGRERFERVRGQVRLSITVPILNLKLDSRTDFDSTGRFRRFAAEAFDAAGDSLLGTYTVNVDRDTLRTTSTSKRTGATTNGTIPGAVAGVLPAQTVAVVALLLRRFPRDTVIRMLPMGGDSTIPVTVTHRGDSGIVSFAGLEARTTLIAGRPGRIEVPVTRVYADLWNGRDTLPALAGVRRPPVDYTAPPGAAYTAREVRVPIQPVRGDTFSLAGTLTLPIAGPRPVPIVVTITGSGQETRDEDLWPLLPNYRPFRQLAERLAREGIGVLRLDDRGVGGSGGPLGTTADYADDVRQAVAWLRAQRDLTGTRIALVGHSEGGVIAPIVAAEDPALAGIVLLAGPSKNGRAILDDQFRRPILIAPGLSDSTRQAELAKVPQTVERFSQTNAWSRWFADYDPLPVLRRLRVPVLILQGALDRQVSAGQADTLAATLRDAGNRDVTEKVYADLNHLFLHTDGDGSPTEYPGLADTRLPAVVLDDLASWLVVRLRR
ncbi:MAG TPA: alpha/beta fold hydrolase [Gemmatimonadales bacterium]|nr:alpha/beta fold hydrolase [Gemmatimonadales bacterium]